MSQRLSASMSCASFSVVSFFANVAIEPGSVPPALVYADLLATGDSRCLETAEIIYDRYLARLFPAA